MFHWWVLEALEHVAMFLFDAAAKVGQHSHDGSYDDDFYDRISRRYSVVLLIIFTVLISTKQYVGEPIACFCPAHFTGTHVEYTNNICWISNTYFVSFDRLLPKYPDPKTEHFIYFYQYVPFILILQAIFFYLPSLIWTSLSSKSGYDLSMLVTQARICDTYTSELRETSTRNLAKYIDRTLEYHRQKRAEYLEQIRTIRCASVLRFVVLNNHLTMGENHLMWAFLFTKTLYLLNAIGQLYVLNFFLGNDYHMYGFAVLRALFTGNNENWTITPRFPRVTWCNFAVRNLADNIHTYTVQCSLPINLFNEKIFLIIWFWLYFITLFTLFGFLYWLGSFFYPPFSKTKLQRYLSSMKHINVHHFPQNPFQESTHYPRMFHRRYSFAHSHHGSMHGPHHHHRRSSFANRAMRTSFDSNRLSRVREQFEFSLPSEMIETSIIPTFDEPSTVPPTPLRSSEIRSNPEAIPNEDNRVIEGFLRDYLGRDGALVLYLLKINTNEVITGEIITALFELFKTNYRTNLAE